MRRLGVTVLIVCLGLPAVPARAVKPLAADVGVDERVGDSLPSELSFTDQRGRQRSLAEFTDGDKPVLLALAYYHCPGLCDISLRELATRLKDLGWTLGKDFRALTISIDPHDTPASAAAKRSSVLALMRSSSEVDWPFLVATPDALQRLTRAIGYRYSYDAPTKQYAHPAASVVLTPSGTISRYVYGPTVEAATLRLALREARAGRGGASSVIDRTVLSCFRYDPATHRYAWLISGVLRIGGIVIFGLLAIAIAIFHRRGRARRSQA